MTEFAEADARLAGMHGYAPVMRVTAVEGVDLVEHGKMTTCGGPLVDWHRGECIGVNWLATYWDRPDA